MIKLIEKIVDAINDWANELNEENKLLYEEVIETLEKELREMK